MRIYMLDTNVFNDILDEKIGGSLPPNARLLVTHIQRDELASTRRPERRDRLLGVAAELAPEAVPTSSGAWDVSRWDYARASDGVRVERIRAALDAKNGRKSNNIKDALIADTALSLEAVLVTGDVDLRDVFRAEGGEAVPLEEAIEAPASPVRPPG